MSVFKVTAKASLPVSSAQWKVDIGDDPKESMIYTNLAYDLIAMSMARLGVAMSEYVLGDDTKLNAIAAETKAGRVE